MKTIYGGREVSEQNTPTLFCYQRETTRTGVGIGDILKWSSFVVGFSATQILWQQIVANDDKASKKLFFLKSKYEA